MHVRVNKRSLAILNEYYPFRSPEQNKYSVNVTFKGEFDSKYIAF